MGHQVTVVGHRGDPYRVRENTLASIRSAYAYGADTVEVDVRLTADRVPVLLHDATLKRLWGPAVRLDALTADRLRALTDGGVPTLAETLAAVGDRPLLLDLPHASEAAARRVVGVVRDAGAADRVHYCAGPAAMLGLRTADPAAEIALTCTSAAAPRPALLAAIRPRYLNYRFGLATSELVTAVHHAGYLLSTWTPDTARSLRRLVTAGVDSITTNRVDVLGRVLASR
ncbi:glycerophosphodiester phosphodiesterase [Streptomyces sp. NPDC060194]|uniref:glycerophosphodiester phosphodiesterase n=1 Tax=Streptomyces sp. NPDC060194 TaxID=3347069 RepID=UPI0036471A88